MNAGLTVAIPAHNAATTVAETVRSVAAQRDVTVEIVLVDDRSNDGTPDIAREAAGDQPFRVVPSRAPGAAAARNTALEAAAHRHVAFLDADDRWLPGAAAATLEAFGAQPGAVACFGAARHVDPSGRLIAEFRVDAANATTEGLVRRRLQPTTSATAVRRDAVLALGGFDEGFELGAGVEDSDLWWRLAREGACVVQPEPLCEYVVDDSRLSSRSTEWLLSQRRDRERCVARMQEALPADLARVGAALHFAVLARYWLAAGQPREARADARRALRYGVTPDGVAAFGLSLVPLAGIDGLRRLRRRALAAQARGAR